MTIEFVVFLCFQIDDGLKMQTEDIENLAGRVAELSADLDIKKEMRNRVTLGELTVVKRTGEYFEEK